MREVFSQGMRFQIPRDVVTYWGPGWKVDVDLSRLEELTEAPRAYGEPTLSVNVSDLSRVRVDGEPAGPAEPGGLGFHDIPWKEEEAAGMTGTAPR